MSIFQKIKFYIYISTKTLFYMKNSNKISARNKIVDNQKFEKLLRSKKFKCYFLLTFVDRYKNTRTRHAPKVILINDITFFLFRRKNRLRSIHL